MDYERIHKVQTGVISPSKLRMKLLGVHNHRKKESTNNSSRTSPSKLEDLEYVKNSLLACGENDGLKEYEGDSGLPVTVANVKSQVAKLPPKDIPNFDQNAIISKQKNDTAVVKTENTFEGVLHQDHLVNSRAIRPARSLAEESNGYDSGHDNGSTSSFEFHRGERTLPSPLVGPFCRPVPSKWNDAEKWIINRQSVHPHPIVLKKPLMQQRHGSQKMNANLGKVAPESTTMVQGASTVQPADTKRIDSCPQTAGVKFPFASFSSHPVSEPEKGVGGPADICPIIVNTVALPQTLKDLNEKELPQPEISNSHTTVPAVKSVSMRDMGTEMTPIASQEPSRTGTPNGAMTPTRSPVSSRASTPRRGVPAPSPFETSTDNKLDHHQEYSNQTESSERGRKLKTRREILALGLQLGKTNIAAWASKDDVEDDSTSHKVVDMDQLEKIEFEARAVAWEEAEKTKHMARYKREEIKIQVWESHQKAKFEAQMKQAETQAEKMKVQSQEKRMMKLSLIKQRLEEKLAAAEARKNRHAARTEQQVEHIRQTGRIPPSHFCCAWFS
uniref:Uncharacterized protein At3g61260 n=1 Tax=Anthurium amnicola TaxID=1678845 RepID=A0A1D1ZFF5_9ARAE